MARTIPAPKDSTGSAWAAVAAIVALMLALSFETQWFARLDSYREAELGTPLIAQLYAPWSSLGWMLKYDTQLDLIGGAFSGRPYVTFRSGEARWARQAFAGERQRLPWEAGGAVVLYIALFIWWSGGRKNSDVHGGAGWARGWDLRRSALTKAQHGITLGQTKRPFGRQGTLLIHNGTENVMGLGPPGEGKTDGISLPTLLKTWLLWSAIVFDPADELAKKTARIRGQHGRIVIFDPRSPKTARFNPLAGIAVGDVDSVRSILASYFYDRDVSEMSSDSRFFESRGLALGVAVAAHVIELGTPTLEAMARYVSDPVWKSEGELCESLLKSKIRYVQETGAEFARMSDKQRSPFIASLTDRLELFRSDAIANATSAADFSPADFRREPTTLYLVVREADQAALNPLMRMLLTCFVQGLTARFPTDKEQPILLLLDEFPLLKAPIIQQKLATMRKYEIYAVLLAQTLSQIRDYYGPNESISGMCDVRVFFPSVDTATQQLAVDTCGQTTRWTESVNRDSTGKIANSTHETGRPLLYPHELADMKSKNEIIIYKKGDRPIKGRRVRSFMDKRFNG